MDITEAYRKNVSRPVRGFVKDLTAFLGFSALTAFPMTAFADGTPKYTISGSSNFQQGIAQGINSQGKEGQPVVYSDGTFENVGVIDEEKPVSVESGTWEEIRRPWNPLYIDWFNSLSDEQKEEQRRERESRTTYSTSRSATGPDTLYLQGQNTLSVRAPINNPGNEDITGFVGWAPPKVVNGVDLSAVDPVTGNLAYNEVEQAWRVNEGQMSVPAPYLSTSGLGGGLEPLLVYFDTSDTTQMNILKSMLGDLDNQFNSALPDSSIEASYLPVMDELGMNPFPGFNTPDMIRQTEDEGAAHVVFAPGSDWDVSFATGRPVITYDTELINNRTSLRREWERANGFADNGRGPLNQDPSSADALDDLILPLAVYTMRNFDGSHEIKDISPN